MSFRLAISVWLLLVGVFVAAQAERVLAAGGDGKDVKPAKTWFGTIKESKLQKLAPKDGIVADAKVFAEIWKAWKPLDMVPAIDFAKDLVLVMTSDEGKVDEFVLKLDKKGDLIVAVGVEGKDKLPGFSFGMAQVSRAGIVSVEGTPLKKK